MKFLDAARRTSTSLDSWRRPLFRTHPGARGPSRPTREREQKAEQHLEDRSDNGSMLNGKPNNSMWGLTRAVASQKEIQSGHVEYCNKCQNRR